MALDAQVDIFGESGLRRIPTSELFVGPGEDVLSETTLGLGDILTRVVIPRSEQGGKSVYLKAKERQAYDFALVSVGGYMEVVDGVVSEVRIVLGGVAPTPYFSRAASDALRGTATAEIDAKAVGGLAVEGAIPMPDNGYKVRLASNLVERAVRTLLDMPD